MSFLLRAIFEGIEAKEKVVTKLYKNLSLKTTNDEIKKTLMQLSKDEFKHAIKMNENLELCDIDLDDDSELKEINKVLTSKVEFDLNKVEEVLDKAISEEEFAMNAYLALAGNFENPLKTILEHFAKDEERHKEVLLALKQEFKESDWN